MALSQYFFDAQLTPVRLVSTANISATYNNGAVNNGLGATLTVAASSLTVDSVVTFVGDRILVANQTNTYENGIYQVTSIGSTVIITRSEDFQNIEQMKLGQWVTSYAGTVNSGRSYVLTAIPAVLGTSAVTFSSAQVAVSGVTVTNQIPVAADTSGTIKASTGVFATLGGSLQADGDITAGEDADAAKFVSYPATTASGTLIFEALDSSGAFNVTVRNASHAQSTVVSIPDGGQATTEFIIADSAGTQTITSGNLSVAVGNLSAGSSGNAGTVSSFPTTAAKGSLVIAAVDNIGDTLVTISNRAHGQASVYSLADVGSATGSILNCAVVADPAANLIWFDVTVNQAALAAGGTVELQASSGSKQYKVRELMHNGGGTNFSGGGGNRLGQVGDGTSIYAITPAASLQTIVNARWGSTDIAFPIAIAANTSTAAGAALVYSYNGGTTDYTLGSVVVSGMVERVA